MPVDTSVDHAGHCIARWYEVTIVTSAWTRASLEFRERTGGHADGPFKAAHPVHGAFFFKRGPGIDDFYQVWVSADDDGQLVGKMRRGKEPSITTIGRVRVWRPDRHSVTIAFPRRYLGRNLTSYHWGATTSYEDERSARCAGDPDADNIAPEPPVCPDRLDKYVVHRLS